MIKTHPFHEKILVIVERFKKDEAQIISLLRRIEEERVYQLLGYSSMRQYAEKALKLSEGQAYSFLNIARACAKVPLLELAIKEERVSISKARRITSVIEQNPALWIERAETLAQRQLEREVVKVNPEVRIQEKIKPIYQNRSILTLGVTGAFEEKLQKARNLVSKLKKESTSIEQTLEAVLEFYLKHKDPVQRAERVLAKPRCARTVPPNHKPIPTNLKHQVMNRDKGKCQTPNCTNTRFVEMHHIHPKSEGGLHALNNLITLCSFHHKQQHPDLRAKTHAIKTTETNPRG